MDIHQGADSLEPIVLGLADGTEASGWCGLARISRLGLTRFF